MNELNNVVPLLCAIMGINLFCFCAIYAELNALHWELRQILKEIKTKGEAE